MYSGEKNTTEYIIKLYKSLFSQNLPNPNPSFPQQFMDQIPNLIFDVNEFTNAIELQSTLKLTMDCRNPIIEFFVKEPEQIHLSQDNKYFTSILSIQSICALFYAFDQCDCYIDSAQLQKFLKCLNLAYILIPSNINYINSILLIIYQTIINELNDQNLPTNSFHKLIEFSSLIDDFLMEFIQISDSLDISVDVIQLLISLSFIILDHVDLSILQENQHDPLYI